MSRVSAKRQVTLPVNQCQELDIKPGDEVEIFAYEGNITIVKKTPGAALGLLRHIKPALDISDEDSLQSAIG